MRELKEAFKYMALWFQQKFYQGFQPAREPQEPGVHIESVIETMGDYELDAGRELREEDDNTATRPQD